jgi:MFS transporter, DHA1 family, staphyloferrin B biosynthesis exporter
LTRAGRHRDSPPARPHRTNLALLWVSQFVNTNGLMMLVPIMPFYVEQLGVQGTAHVQAWSGVAIAAPAVTLTVATPLWGRLGDRVGRRWMVVRALAGLAAAMLVMAAASGPVVLLLGRLLQGALGGVVEAAAGFVGATGPGEERGTSLGKSFSATAAGALTGPLAGGALLGAGGLPGFMVGVAAAAAVLAVVCAASLREAPSGPAGTDDAAARTHRPRSRLGLPGLLPLGTAAVLVYLGVYGLIPVFAEHVATRADRPGTAGMWVGALHSVMWAATLAGSVWWGRRNDRSGRPLGAFTLAAALCAVSIAALTLPVGLFALVPMRIVQGFAFAALAQSLFLHFSRAVPGAGGESGRIGVINSFLLAGQGVGPLLAGPLVATVSVTQAIWLLASACTVAALLAVRPARTESRYT